MYFCYKENPVHAFQGNIWGLFEETREAEYLYLYTSCELIIKTQFHFKSVCSLSVFTRMNQYFIKLFVE